MQYPFIPYMIVKICYKPASLLIHHILAMSCRVFDTDFLMPTWNSDLSLRKEWVGSIVIILSYLIGGVKKSHNKGAPDFGMIYEMS